MTSCYLTARQQLSGNGRGGALQVRSSQVLKHSPFKALGAQPTTPPGRSLQSPGRVKEICEDRGWQKVHCASATGREPFIPCTHLSPIRQRGIRPLHGGGFCFFPFSPDHCYQCSGQFFSAHPLGSPEHELLPSSDIYIRRPRCRELIHLPCLLSCPGRQLLPSLPFPGLFLTFSTLSF